MDSEKIVPNGKYVVTREIVGVCDKGQAVVAEENKAEKGKLVFGKTGMIMCSVALGKSWFFKAEDLEPRE